MRPIGGDSFKLGAEFVCDVESYIVENKLKVDSVDELTPEEFLRYYLNWNGIVGYSDYIVALIGQLGWELKQAPPRTMSDEDRSRLIELILEESVEMWCDEKHHELVEYLHDNLRDGVAGLENQSDADLLAEIDGEVLDKDGKVSVGSGMLDPANNEAHRIWARYRAPDVLCKVCKGVGTSLHPSEGTCPKCEGTGVNDGEHRLPKFTVIRNRLVVEFAKVRAKDAEEAAKSSKDILTEWVEQQDEVRELKVFDLDAPGEPRLLYSEKP